jgi:hypothetical protein
MYIGLHVRYACVRFLKKIEFPQQIFKKYSNIKFYGNHPLEAELFSADEQTGRHDKANS